MSNPEPITAQQLDDLDRLWAELHEKPLPFMYYEARGAIVGELADAVPRLLPIVRAALAVDAVIYPARGYLVYGGGRVAIQATESLHEAIHGTPQEET